MQIHVCEKLFSCDFVYIAVACLQEEFTRFFAVLYSCVLLFLFVIFPLVYFYHEEDEDTRCAAVGTLRGRLLYVSVCLCLCVCLCVCVCDRVPVHFDI